MAVQHNPEGGGMGGGGEDSHIKRGGMLVVSLRGVNLDFVRSLTVFWANSCNREGLL